LEGEKKMTEPKRKRNFTIVGENGSESGKFTASEPKRAAVKAVNQSYAVGKSGIIAIRELGTRKIREYTFRVEEITPSEGAPSWIKGKVKHAVLNYVRIYSKPEAT
jgi:hypothetical protein